MEIVLDSSKIIVINLAVLSLVIIALLYIHLSEGFYNRLNNYRRKYGFDRTLETTDYTEKQLARKKPSQIEKILTNREKMFNKWLLRESAREEKRRQKEQENN